MRRLKAVKASLLLGIFLFSVVAFASVPVIAQGLLQGNVVLEYDASVITGSLRPVSDTLTIPISVDHYVSGPGSKLLVPFYEGMSTVPIELTISSHPEWISASISPAVIYQNLALSSETYSPKKAYLTISLSPNAPAYVQQPIEIVATSQYTPPVRSGLNKIQIPIYTGFYSHFDIKGVKTFQEIGAGEVAEFPINIKGFANAYSLIRFEVVNPPQGWITSINSQITLDTEAYGGDATGNVTLTIQSPLDFGYHLDEAQFTVKATTMAAGTMEGIDNTTILQFSVRARGFSTPGFEIPFTIVALLAIIFIYKRKQKK